MFSRGQSSKQVPVKVAGSSTFGRYPKISNAKTINLFLSDDWLVPYAGYKSIVQSLGLSGRAIYTSNISNQMVAVVDNLVYAIKVLYNPLLEIPYSFVATQVGKIGSFNTYVSIAENNAGQIAICDSEAFYIYTPGGSPVFQQIPNTDFYSNQTDQAIPLYVTFHNTRFILALSTPLPSNVWILSDNNDGTVWPADAAHTSGAIQTKPGSIVAVTRFPSRGNMIFVFGENVVESWFDTGGQLFPYQRNQSFNVDYGLLSPASLAANDEMVVWLAQNEKSGPVIMASNGGTPDKITTDGIDHLLSNISNPYDSEAFLFRQDGHLIYHINFYTDNFSLFYDFNTKKFFHASDEDGNYFIASDMAFFNNQYYFVSRNNGNVYAFDTAYTTYDGAEIPRTRVCDPIRLPTQDFFVVNDVGFTMQQGVTDPIYLDTGPSTLITQDGNPLITQGNSVFLQSQDFIYFITQDGHELLAQQVDSTDFDYLTTQTGQMIPIYPRVDMSFSIDGGESFSNNIPYHTNPLGLRVNKILYWRLGYMNELQIRFDFWGYGPIVAKDGIATLRV